MECKICKFNDVKVIGDPRINNKFPKIIERDYKIVQCINCKLYFIHPGINLDQDEWKELYEDNYFEHHNTTKWHKELHIKERKERLEKILHFINKPIGNLLDMGCGEGYVLSESLKYGFVPYGLDIADNIDKSLERKDINFYKGNIFDAKYPDNYFSAIYTDSVFEHLDYPIEVLKELYRIVQPNGVILLIVPNEDCLVNDIKKIVYTLFCKRKQYGRIKPFVPPYHINGFNPESLSNLVNLAGFELLEICQFGGDYQMWKAYKRFSKLYFIELLLHPFRLISIMLKKEIQLQVIFRKKG